MRPSIALPLALFVLLVLPAAMGCSTYRDDLSRGQTAFEQNSHERALAIFRLLEPDTSHLSTPERAHYAYLRGMTDYRIGYRADARHWLLLAQSMESETPGVLPADWKTRMTEAIAEMNEAVYQNGIESLTNNRRSLQQQHEDPAPTPPVPAKAKKSVDEP